MSEGYKREFLYHTDDEQDAFDEAAKYWVRGEKNITVARVNQMKNPPNTVHKFVVIRITRIRH